ncbi:MAG: Hpt domain-containing protein [Actinomycetota bacterium]
MAGDPPLPDLDPAALARAEAALDALQDSYAAWLQADLARLDAALAAGDLAGAFAVAHDIKGQAATFGYPRVTELAGELCRRLKAGGDGSTVAAMVAELKAAAS